MPNPDISVLAVDDVSWTPIKPTIDCTELVLINPLGADLLFRRTDTDPNSEITIPSLTERSIYSSKGKMMLHASQTVGYGKLSAGAGNIKRYCAY